MFLTFRFVSPVTFRKHLLEVFQRCFTNTTYAEKKIAKLHI